MEIAAWGKSKKVVWNKEMRALLLLLSLFGFANIKRYKLWQSKEIKVRKKKGVRTVRK